LLVLVRLKRVPTYYFDQRIYNLFNLIGETWPENEPLNREKLRENLLKASAMAFVKALETIAKIKTD
jgi:hypothetical protein